ncbi:MAG: hypothetical protein JWR55_2305 [Aeromicrobium sp.]|jgi:hypothetical protein|nr:hypothetical protein [Aeromicrobium sp.]
MTQTPPDDVDQDSEPPVGAPAPDPGGEPVDSEAEGSGRVEHPESGASEADATGG